MGGSHVSALGLIRGLDRERFTPVVLLHDASGPFAELLGEFGIDFESLNDTPILGTRHSSEAGETGPIGYLVRTLPVLCRTISRIDPQIVHTNDGRMHVNWALPSKLSGRKLLWHHRQDPDAFGVNKIAPFLADHIASVSHFSKPRHPLRNIDGRFSVVRSPFSFPDEVPERRGAHQSICHELGLPAGTVLLGYFGNLVDRKRPLHFVRAVAAVKEALPDSSVHGLLFGRVEQPESGLDDRVMALADDLGIAGAIHLMGFRDPIAPYMAGTDVSLVTAMNEPFGRTLIEAMHLGTPVVATNHGGNPEAIENGVNGFLVEPFAPEAFVKPVLELLQNKNLRGEIVQTARQGIEEKYGEARHISDVSAIYEKLLRS